MLDSFQNFATFLSPFNVKFWLCLTNASDASKMDLDLLKLLEEAKTKVRDQGTIVIVEAAYVKLKDHLCTRVADREKKEMANAIFKYVNQARPVCQQMHETEDFGAKFLKHFVGPDSGICFELPHGKEPAFLRKRVDMWSNKESYLSLKKLVKPITVVNDCIERSLGLELIIILIG